MEWTVEGREVEGAFPEGPVVKTRCSQCRGHGSEPWLGKFKVPWGVANIKQIKEVEREEGPGRVRLGPSAHVGEKEQDPSEERDDLAGQPQVVHRGAVRVWRLVGSGKGM